METEDQKNLMLQTVGEAYIVVSSGKVVKAIPGQTTNMIADYHNPYDTQNQDYTLTTTQAEVASKDLVADQIIQDKFGTHLRVITINADLTGWLIVRVSWEDGHVHTTTGG